jgi:hypothetical protein
MRFSTTTIAAATCFSLIGLAGARAQMAFVEADFETTFASFGYSYDYSGFGDASCSVNTDSSDQTSSSYDVPTAAGGSAAATGTMLASNWMIPVDSCYNYAGWGLGVGFVFFDKVLASGNLADYRVIFDASVTGYDAFDDGLSSEVTVIFQAPDDDDPDADAEGYGLSATPGNPGNLPAVPLLTSTPQTFTVNLGDLNPPTTFDYDFTTDFADTFIVMLQLAPAVNAGEIGVDDDTILTVDNVRFEGPFTQLLEGDFDDNQRVDGHDFLVWQRGDSPNAGAPEDLDLWRANYGQPAVAAAVSAIPEPGSALMAAMLLGIGAALARSRIASVATR